MGEEGGTAFTEGLLGTGIILGDIHSCSGISLPFLLLNYYQTPWVGGWPYWPSDHYCDKTILVTCFSFVFEFLDLSYHSSVSLNVPSSEMPLSSSLPPFTLYPIKLLEIILFICLLPAPSLAASPAQIHFYPWASLIHPQLLLCLPTTSSSFTGKVIRPGLFRTVWVYAWVCLSSVIINILSSLKSVPINYIITVFIALYHSHLYLHTRLISKFTEDRSKVMFIFLSPITPSEVFWFE